MQREPIRILLIEDSQTEARRFHEVGQRALRSDLRFTWASGIDQGLSFLREKTFDAVVLDLQLPGADAHRSIDAVRAAAPAVPIVVWTAEEDESMVVGALQRGVQEYLTGRQLEVGILGRTIRNAIARQRLLVALERSNRDLGEFAQSVSHDLKAPLRAISHMAKFLEQDLKEHLTPQAEEYLRRLQDRVGWLNQMINGLLAFARAGTTTGPVEDVAVVDVVQHVQDLLQVPPGIRVEVQGDLSTLRTQRVLLHEVFQNLIGNAVKHRSSPHGLVRISSRDLEAAVEFTIEDDGPGLSPQRREDLFQPFRPGQPGPDNTGLGLPLVKRILEREGGTLRYEPGPTGGSRFVFTWPKLDVVKVVV